MIVTVSDQEIIVINSCHAMTERHNELLPNQPSLAVFYNVHDVTERDVEYHLGTFKHDVLSDNAHCEQNQTVTNQSQVLT